MNMLCFSIFDFSIGNTWFKYNMQYSTWNIFQVEKYAGR